MKLSFVVPVDPGFARFLAELSELGYNGVELSLPNPHRIDQSSICQKVEEHGLEISAIGTGQAYLKEGLSLIGPRREESILRVREFIDFGALVNAVVIIGLIRGKRGPLSEKEASGLLSEALADCADYGEDAGVKMALEPINRYETDYINRVEEALGLIGDRKNLGLLIDSFHMNIEEASIERSIALSLPHLFHVHLADSNRLAPGWGHLDFEAVLRALGDYDKYMSAEIFYEDRLEAAKQTIDFIRDVKGRL